MFGKKKKRIEALAPKMGKIADFMNTYPAERKDLVLGREGLTELAIDVEPNQMNRIMFICNDDAKFADEILLPMIDKQNLSYVIYDPNGSYYEATKDELQRCGYDVEIIDVQDAENKIRIDLFEVVNITKNPYCNALIFANSVKCVNEQETTACVNLFMAIMTFLLARKNSVKMNDMAYIFNQIKAVDATTIKMLVNCAQSYRYIQQFAVTPKEVKRTVLQLVEDNFFNALMPKTSKPNMFIVALSSKKKVFFLKRVPAKYKTITTTLLFNLKASSSLLNTDHDADAVILDTNAESWYNRNMLVALEQENDGILNDGIVNIMIREKETEENRHLTLFMNSDDPETVENVYQKLNAANMFTEEEKTDISHRLYGKKPIPEVDFGQYALPKEEVEHLNGIIVLDKANKVKPILINF